MKITILATLVLALAASGAHAESANPGSARGAQATTNDSSGGAAGDAVLTDQTFLKKAAAGGIAEVETAKIALEKASDKEVKEFAQHMINDHSQNNKELEEVAKNMNETLPKDTDPKHKAMMDQLKAKSGAEFDRAYMQAQVRDHQEMITLFKQQAESGKHPELKSYATKTLPALEKHLDHARKVTDGGL
ncbi:MAG TPA: DUF4142 domain-containing protein [Candidatus Limnocylindrales bacterium]|nr:DUF4142 domain-containing protein [Candidatus Limnocylindrales bacterium]